ncbi:MAG: DUF427 domain-containing protein [Planctomycetota bacterium]
MSPKRIEPGPGQESVWDYPRPPRVEESDRHVQVIFNGETIADTRHAKRVLETSHPPVYYIPREHVRPGCLEPTDRQSFCEWKGVAAYFTVIVGDRRAVNAAWGYPRPTARFAPVRDHVAFYPDQMDACLVDGVPVQPQPGDYYGGWITPDIVGPFKGGPDTTGW